MTAAVFSVLGIEIWSGGRDRALDEVCQLVSKRRGGYVCFTGAHGLSEAYGRPEIHRAHRDAAIIMPDGVPLVWLGRLRGCSEIEQVAGPEFLPILLRAAEARGWRVYWFGGSASSLHAAVSQALNSFPGLVVCGTASPPFGPVASWDHEKARRSIVESRADIVVVALSTPKQEEWMSVNAPHLQPAVLLGFGAAVDVLSGIQRSVPSAIRGSGFEWAYRLAVEPKRLWRRYARAVPTFLWLALRELRRPVDAA